jgi:hypothetical protein
MKRSVLLLLSGAVLCAAQGGFLAPGRYMILNVKSNKALEATRVVFDARPAST